MLEFSRANAIETFNTKFNVGLQYMRSCEMNDAEIAQFLFNNKKDIDFSKLGECLGDNHCTSILKAYMKQFDFSEMDFSSALRFLMTDFQFPGEAQQIDRIMEAFGNHYFESNENRKDFEFKNKDAAYTLAFSCVMLNTDAHNPQVKNKMTFEQFKSNNRGMNSGENFSEELLAKIYKDITLNKIKLTKPSKPEASLEEMLASTSLDERSEKNKKPMLSNYDRWKSSQGGNYKPGYLTYSFMESTFNKISNRK